MSSPANLNPDSTVSGPSAKTAVIVTEGTKIVTTAGTAALLVSTYTPVESVLIFPLRTNGGAAFVGTVGASAAQHIVTPVVLSGPDGKFIDLHTLYIDVEVNGEGVGYLTLS